MIRVVIIEENRSFGDVNAPRVLGYQLHPRRSPRRENVIRINNSNSPSPSSFHSIRIRTIPPPHRFRSTNFSRWRYHSREHCILLPCATKLFPPFLTCPSFRCRKAWGTPKYSPISRTRAHVLDYKTFEKFRYYFFITWTGNFAPSFFLSSSSKRNFKSCI